MRPQKMTLSTVMYTTLFLVALIMGGVWMGYWFFYRSRSDGSIYVTQWIVAGYIAFYLVLILVVAPLMRWLLKSLRVRHTHPLDALWSMIIIIFSSVPLAVLCLTTINLMRVQALILYRYYIFHVGASASLLLLGTIIRYHGNPPPKNKQFILLADHKSPWDYLGITHAMGHAPFNVVAGINLKQLHLIKGAKPTFGDKVISWTIGSVVDEHAIGVDRDDFESKQAAVSRMYEELYYGKNIAVFPEGTRMTFKQLVYDDKLLLGFKNTIFNIAFETGTPIQLLVFDCATVWKGKSDPRFLVRPTVVDAYYIELVDPAKFSKAVELREYCREKMEAQLRKSKRIERFKRTYAQ